jgi:DNA-binding protein HU-beta
LTSREILASAFAEGVGVIRRSFSGGDSCPKNRGFRPAVFDTGEKGALGYGVFAKQNRLHRCARDDRRCRDARHVGRTPMADARRMGKSELFSHFAERFEVKRTQAREYFDELTALAEKELKRSGEFVLPGMVKLVVQKRKARMGRNPATGEAIKIPAKTVVKARIAKQLKDAVLPRK